MVSGKTIADFFVGDGRSTGATILGKRSRRDGPGMGRFEGRGSEGAGADDRPRPGPHIKTYFSKKAAARALSCGAVQSTTTPGSDAKRAKSRRLVSDVGPSVAEGPTPQRLVQLHLDFGQKDFDSKQCRVCGMRYAIGIKEDEDVHRRFHTEKLEGVKFKGWASERMIWQDRGQERVVIVTPEDPPLHWWKVQDVCHLIEEDLGTPKDWILKNASKVFLYIADQRVIGCAVVECVTQAYRVVLSGGCQSPAPAASRVMGSTPMTPSSCPVPASPTGPLSMTPMSSSASVRAAGDEGNADGSSDRPALRRPLACTPQEAGAGQQDRSADRNAGRDTPRRSPASTAEEVDSVSGAYGPLGPMPRPVETHCADADNNGGDGPNRQPRGSIFNVRTPAKSGLLRTAGPAGRGRRGPADRGVLMLDKSRPVRVSCGVRAMWVCLRHRRRGVASRQLDAVRGHALFGYVVPRRELAFTQLTEEGRRLAEAYLGDAPMCVYE
ncbi:unnamed protein product [Ostreobium quekettii]|uniref:Uncharacterized protein n=1 Tax=Ostreobium quekettii TaxID=121088 RepID=A0A8S1IRM0_9CHLO|nr:unnamed protein product [Ostreobium quekettii]|eukprot:evm.model.scf_1026.3 EVM.evm.TU.scf_1026.3   scf_1026:22156-26619(-)